MVFKSVEICKSLYLVEPYCVGVDCLEAVCKLRLIYIPRFSFYRCPPTFDTMSCFLDSYGPITFNLRSEASL
jgi:hypothetical protein